MAGAIALGAVVSTYQPAEAHRGGRTAAAVGLGIIGGLAIGAAAANAHTHYGPRCYVGPEECGWRDRHCFVNRYGDHVCRGGRYTCWRSRYCD